MMNDWIVMVDPGGLPTGTVITGEEKLIVEACGGITLPGFPKHLKDSGIGGYSMRFHGNGIELTGAQGSQLIAPMVLFADPEVSRIHWAVGLEYGAPSTVSGTLGLSIDRTQRAGEVIDLSDANPFPLRAERSGKTAVRGVASIRPMHAAIYAFAWYGAGTGARVMWTALTATP